MCIHLTNKYTFKVSVLYQLACPYSQQCLLSSSRQTTIQAPHGALKYNKEYVWGFYFGIWEREMGSRMQRFVYLSEKKYKEIRQ